MEKILTIQLKIDDSGKPMKPVFVEIDNTLKAMQEFVAGNIEVINDRLFVVTPIIRYVMEQKVPNKSPNIPEITAQSHTDLIF